MSLFRTNLGWAALPARLALGIIFLVHGSQKLYGGFGGHGIAGTAQFFGQLGVQPPLLWAWIVALVEFIGGAAVIVGLLTRPASLGLAAVMVVAIVTVHWPNGFVLGQGPAMGYEYNIALLGLSLSLFIGGGGAASIDGAIAGEPATSEAPAAPAAPEPSPPPA